MEKGYLMRLKGNLRYFLVNCDSGQYLIDADKFWFGHLFPVLNYILPVNAIKLTEDLPEHLIKEEGEKESKKGFWFSLVGILAFQHFVLTPLLNTLSADTEFEQNLTILISTAIMIVILKIFVSVLGRRKVRRYVDLKELETERMTMRPSLVKIFPWAFVLHILCIGFTLVGIHGYLFYGGHLAFLLTFFGFGFGLTMMSWAVMPYVGSNYEFPYKVRFLKKK